MVNVSQEAREASAANILARLVFQHGGEQPWMDASTMSMRMGEQDDHWEVQAFAKFEADVLERAACVADDWANPNNGAVFTANGIAQAIRNLKGEP